jgi:hypothetical protein
MEYLKIVWIIIFFVFSLCLFFVWSKILVLFKRTAAIVALLADCERVSDEMTKSK